MFNVFPMLQSIAKKSLAAHPEVAGDYYDKENLLVCGVCGERKQEIKLFHNPTEGNLERQTPLKIGRDCKCVRDQKKKEDEESKRNSEIEYAKRLRAASMMDLRFENASFSAFRSNEFNEKNLKLCKRYAEAFDRMLEKAQGLLFYGNVGTGKTYAAACIANYLIENGVPVIMTSFVKLLELIQNNVDQEERILGEIGRASLVIFDDLGAERKTDYALEKVYNFVDERYRARLPMILTTNLTIEEMKTETDIRYSRIYDRIFETCYPMQFTGVSWRKSTAYERFEEMKNFLESDE